MNLTRELEPVWLVSTMEKKLTRHEVQKIDIAQSTRELSRKIGSMSLRVESQLLYGLAAVVNRKAHLLLEDSTETNRGLIKIFNQNEIDLVARPDANEYTLASQPLQVIDLLPRELNLGGLLANPTESLVTSQGQPLSSDLGIDMDQSIDIVTRRGGDGNELDDSILPQSEHDEQVLSRLNLADDLLSDLDIPMDMSSPTMDMSSPPAEVSTPPGSDPADVMIVDSDVEIVSVLPKSKARKRSAPKRKLAVVDPETTAPLPRRPADKTMATPARLAAVGAPSVIDKLMNPERIRLEIKRRRLLGDDPEPETVAESSDFEVPELDDTTVFFDEADQEPEVGPLELEDASAVEAEAAAAQRALQDALADGPTVLQTIGITRLQKAAAFSELLAMAARGDALVQQAAPFAEIRIHS